MSQIRIGIVGYGNIGRGVEAAIARNPDCRLDAVFTRRDPKELSIASANVIAASLDRITEYKDKIDVMLLCGGSMSDLPIQGPQIAEHFSTVDSYDNHAKIPEYLASVNAAAKKGNTVALISAGWDPGLFSMARLLGGASLPDGTDYTFWGRGVSQGHSDAVRRVDGVANAIQYTVPIPQAVDAVRSGSNPVLATRQKHTRECYVVAKPGADLKQIEADIKNMPNYFADYDTTVTFVTAEELKAGHSKMPHAGSVLRSGITGSEENTHVVEFSLTLGSNPEFTGSVMVAFARAATRLSEEGKTGGFTPFDVPLAYLSATPRDQLIKSLL